MAKLGSEFHKNFDNFERPIAFGRTKRQLILYLGIVIAIGLSLLLYWLNFPKIIIFIILLILLAPVVIYGSKKDEVLKERYRFLLKVQKRSYQTESQSAIPKLTKNDFKQKKGEKISEINES